MMSTAGEKGTCTKVIGVNLKANVEGLHTNIGAVLLSGNDDVKLSGLRNLIVEQIVACPADFSFCTKQGWTLSDLQEDSLLVSNIVNDKDEVYIKTKCEEPKCGVRDRQGNVVGFVHTSYSNKLRALRNIIHRQVLQSSMFSEAFQFLDDNSWPVSSFQENHMTVYDILIGCCVSTNIQTRMKSPMISPPKGPPLKKLKLLDTQLSFRSGKDLSRNTSSDSTDGHTSKQVLISYVRSEAASHALTLKEQLTAQGFSVYLDVHEIQTGVDWQDSLNFAVSGCEVFVPLVTHKYGKTQWTNREVKLADVLGKYILPVSFLQHWPPRCLAIQFATTQFIPWLPQDKVKGGSVTPESISDWSLQDIKHVAEQISSRIQGLSLAKVPSLTKRLTVVRSCPCVYEDNSLATPRDREGTQLVMICLHPNQQKFGEELRGMLEKEGMEVWCTTQIDKSHMDHIDSYTGDQEGITYSILDKKDEKALPDKPDNKEDLRNISLFQEKADEAGVVLFILSEAFSQSRACQQQVFYCEHRKRVIPVLYEDFKMPDWLSMLVGSHGLESKNDEDFKDVLLHRVRSSVSKMKRTFTSYFSPSLLEYKSFPGSPNTGRMPRFTRTPSIDQSVNPLKLVTRGITESEESLPGSAGFSQSSNPMVVVNGSGTTETTPNETSDKAFKLSPVKEQKLSPVNGQNGTHDSQLSSKPSLSSMKTLIL